jgi:hypothetical protein
MRYLVAALSLLLMTSGCSTAPIAANQPTLARFFLESSNNEGVHVVLPQSETGITVAVKPVFSEFDITRVEIAQVELGKCLLFQLTPAAARDLYRLSASNSGHRLVLMVNGRAIGARRIEQPLNDGAIVIFVEAPDEALPELQAGLRKTALELQRRARKL